MTVSTEWHITALPPAMRYILKAESNDRRGARRKLYCIIAGSAVTAFARLMSLLSWLFSINFVIDSIHMTHPVLSRKHDFSCFFSIESYQKWFRIAIHLMNDLGLLY